MLLPEALRTFYDAHHLIFREENQRVVSWGIPRDALRDEDPVVWQRNNTLRELARVVRSDGHRGKVG